MVEIRVEWNSNSMNGSSFFYGDTVDDIICDIQEELMIICVMGDEIEAKLWDENDEYIGHIIATPNDADFSFL